VSLIKPAHIGAAGAILSRTSTRWLAAAGVLLLLAGAAVYVFEWNMLRGHVAERVAKGTGRSFVINGDLQVELGRTPRITADGLVLGNAGWGKEPVMAEIGQVSFTVDPWAWWRGRWVLPDVKISNARLLLEKNAQGAANWDFSSEKKDAPPAIGALILDRAHITYRDPAIKSDFATDVSTVPPDQKDAGMLKVAGKGRIQGQPATIEGTVGSVLALSPVEHPYPINLRGVIGPTRARVHGTLTDPLNLKSEDVSFELEGADMAQLLPLIGVPFPPPPPYKLSGQLTHSGAEWTFRKFAGRVGKSDLSGDFKVDRAQQPQFITANLVSRNLDLKDLGGFIGADRGSAKASPKPPVTGRVLPQEPFNLEKLRIANASVRFRGERVITERLPLDKLTVTMKLDNGVLTLEPLNFGVAGGNVISQVRMDARKRVIATRLEVVVKQVRLEQLFPNFRLSRANAGVLTGRAKLSTTGNSMAKMLAEADGDAALMMQGGSVSELMVRLINLDVANAIPVLLTGDKQLPVRCMVAHLKGKDGAFNAETLVIDTGKAVVTGTGGINFRDESVDLKLVSKSKGFSLAALRGPIRITGTFSDPKAGPDIAQAVGRGVAAVALGWVTGGLGALIPLVDLGGAEDSDCAALIKGSGQQPARKAVVQAVR
jgi:AsmA family protein